MVTKTKTSAKAKGKSGATRGGSSRSKSNSSVSRPAPKASSKVSQSELALTHSLLDRVSSAVMVVDLDFVVIYVNKATMDLFARHMESLKKLFPGFNPENIIGTCIDRFHRAPEHQRRLLADPRNLPFTTDITVGSAKIQLHVTPNLDQHGQPTGYSLEWCDVTQLRESSGTLAAITKAYAVIEFQLDGTILTANEVFCRTMGYQLDEIVGKHHRMFVDPNYAASSEYREFWARVAECR